MKEEYRVIGVVEDDVPDWQRRPPKWTQLVEEIINLEPGQKLVLEFDDVKTAERARNAVRDVANLRAKAIVVRTRLVEKNGRVRLWLIRVRPDQGVPPPPKQKK
jgi:hypothetical protein